VLLSLVLFGSRARGDHRLTSDVDLLGVVEGGVIKEEISSRGTSFYRYPLETLRAKSEDGDLFVVHLASEGKILHDTAQLFADVCEQFRYRDSYERDLREASGVVYYFLDRPKLLQSRAARKRLVWGLRTILIARSAEQRIPAFSSSALAKFAGNDDIKPAIDKRFAIPGQVLCDLSEKVASGFGVTRALLKWPIEPTAQQELLCNLGGVAKATAEGLQRARNKSTLDQLPVRPFYI
jgi:predicted nucleotidyltransferase